jgi:hypothetical protein
MYNIYTYIYNILGFPTHTHTHTYIYNGRVDCEMIVVVGAHGKGHFFMHILVVEEVRMEVNRGRTEVNG